MQWSDSSFLRTKKSARIMHRDDVEDLLDRQEVLADTLAAGVSDRDRPFLVAELNEVRTALASLGRGSATG